MKMPVRVLALDETAGAFSSVGMGLNALLTAIWRPALIAALSVRRPPVLQGEVHAEGERKNKE